MTIKWFLDTSHRHGFTLYLVDLSSDGELTHLRKQAYHLPTHFVLGRNRNLQGLAAAILKPWEKCHIAKITVKWGIPNTSKEQMASELKLLTGGVLLLQAKIAFLQMLQILKQTKKRRSKASNFKKKPYVLIQLKCLTINTLKEFQTIQSKHEGFKAGTSEAEIQVVAEKLKLDKAIRIQEPKDLMLKMQISKASKELAKLNSAWEPVDPNEDREIITSEAALEGGFLPSLSCPL